MYMFFYTSPAKFFKCSRYTSVLGHWAPCHIPPFSFFSRSFPSLFPLSSLLPVSYSYLSCPLFSFLHTCCSLYSLILLLLLPPMQTNNLTHLYWLFFTLSFAFSYALNLKNNVVFSACLSLLPHFPHPTPSLFSISFMISLAFTLFGSLLSIYCRQLRKTEESFGTEPEQTLISNQPPWLRSPSTGSCP